CSRSSARSDLKTLTFPLAPYNFRMRAICDESDMRTLLSAFFASPEICCANLDPPSKGGWAPRDQPWQPSWYIPAIRLVLRTKLLAQRGLFDDHDDCEREHPEEHTPHHDALIAEQKRFAQ